MGQAPPAPVPNIDRSPSADLIDEDEAGVQQQQQTQQGQQQGRRQLSGDRGEAESEQEARQRAPGRNNEGESRELPQGDAAETTYYGSSRALDSQGGEGDGSSGGGEKGTGREDGMVEFRLDGRVGTLMAGDAMRDYLNRLVEDTVADTDNQVRPPLILIKPSTLI